MNESDPMDALPILPAEIGPGGAGLWAANILMSATDSHGWNWDDVSEAMLTLCLVPLIGGRTDHEILESVRSALVDLRGSRKPRN